MPSSIVCSSRTSEHAAALVGVIAKRRYRIASGRATDGQPAAVVHESAYVKRNGFALLEADSDEVAIHKSTTDIVLVGAAYSHHAPRPEVLTRLDVGAVSRKVNVLGDRRLRVVDGRLSATAPTPFERMPLSWGRAYGGRDRGSEEIDKGNRTHQRGVPTEDQIIATCPNAYPRNPHGKGFAIDVDRQRLDGLALPNQSDPADPVTVDRLLAADAYDWADRPVAAGYGPIDIFTFPRVALAGLKADYSSATRTLREVSLGALGPGPGPFNCAAPGLGNVRLEGNERVELTNLHPSAERYAFALPAQRPRMLIEPQGTRPFELEVKLATVLIEPDKDHVTLTWAGSMACAAEYPDAMCRAMRHAVHWS